jgi:hypothetical protein
MASDARHEGPKQGKPERAAKKSRPDPLGTNPKDDVISDSGSESIPRKSTRRSEYESYYRDF